MEWTQLADSSLFSKWEAQTGRENEREEESKQESAWYAYPYYVRAKWAGNANFMAA